MSYKKDNSHKSQHQQDRSDDEDGQVPSSRLFLFVSNWQVSGEDALS